MCSVVVGAASKLAFVTALAGVALSGCGSGAAREVSPDDSIHLADLTGQLSVEDSHRLEYQLIDLIEQRTAECMLDRGFVYYPFRPEDISVSHIEFGWLTIEYAQKYGFGASTVRPPITAPQNPNNEELQGMSPEQRSKFGDAQEACIAKVTPTAQRELGYSGIFDVYSDLEAQTLADRRVVAVAAEWSSCAALAGYPSDTRIALVDTFYASAESAKVAAQARLTAAGQPSDIASTYYSPEMDEVATAERRAAVAVFPCTDRYYKVFNEVFNELSAGRG